MVPSPFGLEHGPAPWHLQGEQPVGLLVLEGHAVPLAGGLARYIRDVAGVRLAVLEEEVEEGVSRRPSPFCLLGAARHLPLALVTEYFEESLDSAPNFCDFCVSPCRGWKFVTLSKTNVDKQSRCKQTGFCLGRRRSPALLGAGVRMWREIQIGNCLLMIDQSCTDTIWANAFL